MDETDKVQNTDTGSASSLNDQKNKFWAMSFESSKQPVRCNNCGSVTLVSRMGEDTGAAPARSELFERTAGTQAALARRTSEAYARAVADRTTIVGLSALSAGLAVALLLVLRKK